MDGVWLWQIRAVANIAVRDRNRIEFIGNCATIASTSVTVIDWIIDVMCVCVLMWCTQQRKRNESGMKYSIFVLCSTTMCAVMCCRFAVSVVFFGFWMFDVFFGRKQELADENYDIFIYRIEKGDGQIRHSSD